MKILLLSYPRSGSNFTTYILDFLLKHPFWFNKQGEHEWIPGTMGSAIEKTTKGGAPQSIFMPDKATILSKTTGEKYAPSMTLDAVGYEPSRVIKLHGQDAVAREEVENTLNNEPTLLLLLRNPFEAFHSHLKHEGFGHPDKDDSWYQEVTGYFFENLKTFHSYGGRKKVIFYEDLISDPSQYIKDLCYFLGMGTSIGEIFMSQYKTHFDISRHLYQNNQRSCETNGKTTDYFSKECPQVYKDTFWRIFFDLCERTGTKGAEVYCRRYYEDFIGSQ